MVARIALENNLPDHFTKALPQKSFDTHVEGMGVRVVGVWL